MNRNKVISALLFFLSTSCFLVFAIFATLWSIFPAMHGYPAVFGGAGFLLGALAYGSTSGGEDTAKYALRPGALKDVLNYPAVSMAAGLALFIVEINLPSRDARIILGYISAILTWSSVAPYLIGKLRSGGRSRS